MKKIILALFVMCSTTFYAQNTPIRKALKGESFIGAFLGNDTYFGGNTNSKVKSQLLETQYEYFLSNKTSIGVFASFAKRLTKDEKEAAGVPKYSDNSVGLMFNHRIASGLLFRKDFYSYVGIKGGYRGTTYNEVNKNLILSGIHLGAKLFVSNRLIIQLELGGMIFPTENNYGNLAFSPRFGLAYKL